MLAAGTLALVLAPLLSPPATAPPEPGIAYEAEAASNTLNGATSVGECAACSGRARVRNLGKSASNALVVNNVTVGVAGRYSLLIDYVLHGSRVLFVSVNGGPGLELPLTGTNWHAPSRASLMVSLESGGNTLRFYNDRGAAPDLDRIIVR
jgi:hypothetical protein